MGCGLGKLALRCELGGGGLGACGQAQLLGRGFNSPSSSPVLQEEVFLPCPTGRGTISRDPLLEGTKEGAQPPAVPSLLPGPLLILNAHIALV